VFIYDGECPFCKNFAMLSKLRSGIKNLKILDGRNHLDVLYNLTDRGFSLENGAIVISDNKIYHGSSAIVFLVSRMKYNENNFTILSQIMSNHWRSRIIYPLLLIARRIALLLENKPVNPLLDISD